MSKLVSSYTLEVKKSKFIAQIYDVESKEDAINTIESLKKEHKKARHIPYAYKINNDIKKSDDKEPSNTAGTPLYNLIINNDLNNTLIVVIRYFGGTKLGAGLLTRSYLNSAIEAIKSKN